MKSNKTLSVAESASASVGIPSCVSTMPMHASVPPGIGGVAIARIDVRSQTEINHTEFTCTP